VVANFELNLYRDALLRLHDHICPRQILGLRMGLYGAALLNVDVPQMGKRLLAFVETSGCFADGLSVATGCTFGHRTLYPIDYGKVAVTLVDCQTEQAIRIAPHRDSRAQALQACPSERSHWHSYLAAYQILDDEVLLTAQPVTINLSLKKLISQAGYRVVCEVCGEEILNEREEWRNGLVLCRACASDAYYTPISLKISAKQ
jgi:formylmethanofuran dehydrogenase subunit E